MWSGNNKLSIVIFFVLSTLLACSEQSDPELAFKNGNYEVAFEIWKKRAEDGQPEAQNFLGTHYLFGLGIKKDIEHARYWYEKAAKHGHPDAQRNLGSMYESGLGSVAPDFEQAFIWFYAAHRQGHPLAGPSLDALVNKLTPNNKIVLKKQAREYIVNEVLGAEDDDY